MEDETLQGEKDTEEGKEGEDEEEEEEVLLVEI